MNKIFRWQGLVAFLILIALLWAFSALLLDRIVKTAIEYTATQAVGAEVNVAAVSHQFSPFGFTLHHIQVTDRANPANNQVEISNASAQVALMPFVMGKVIIDELVADGVAFNQPRERAGEVLRAPDESIVAQFTPDEIELPSVEQVLEKSPLKTTAAALAAEQAYQQHKSAIETAFNELPNKQRLQDYRTRLMALKESDYQDPQGFIAAKKQFDQLKQDLMDEQQKLKDFKALIEKAKADLTPKLAALKSAPGQDYDLLKGLVAGDAAAFGDLTQAVFGAQARKWSNALFTALEIVGPLLQQTQDEQQERQREQGKWYTFTDESGLPELLIRRAKVNIQWQQQRILADWHDITTDHAMLGKPTRFLIDSEQSPLWQKFTLNGEIELLPAGISAQQNWQLDGVVLKQLGLSKHPKLTAQLEEGLLSSSGSVTVNENVLTGSGTLLLNQMALNAQGSNKLTNAVADALTQLNQITMNSDISGSLSAPSFSLNSDLDNQLGGALTASLSAEAQTKLDKLQNELDAKAASALGTTGEGMSQWLNYESLAEVNLNSIQNMLQTQMQSNLDKKKDELKDKLKDKLFGQD